MGLTQRVTHRLRGAMQMCWKEVQGAASGVRCLWNSKEEEASLSTGERSRR